MWSQDSFINRHFFRAKGWLSTEDLVVDRRPAFACSGVRLKPGGKAESMDPTFGPGPKGRKDISSCGMYNL